MRLLFILGGEIGGGLRRNLSMVISVVLVTFVSLTFVGAAGMLQMQINQMKGYWYDKVQVAVFLCNDGSTAVGCASGGSATKEQQDNLQAMLESPGNQAVHQRLPVRVPSRGVHALQGTVLQLADSGFRIRGPVAGLVPDQHEEPPRKIRNHQ